jgi:hypothetical protein
VAVGIGDGLLLTEPGTALMALEAPPPHAAKATANAAATPTTQAGINRRFKPI